MRPHPRACRVGNSSPALLPAACAYRCPPHPRSFRHRDPSGGQAMSKSKKRRADQPRRGWFTKPEAAKIDALATEYGGFANLVRVLALKHRIRTKTETALLARLLAALGKIGGNVNQLAKRANEGRFNADAIEDAMREITEWRGAILEALAEPAPKPPPDEAE